MHETEGADAGRKLDEVGRKDKEKDGSKVGKKFPRQFAALEDFGNIIVDEFDEPFKEKLDAGRREFEPFAYKKANRDENSKYHPTHEERIRNRNTKK